MSVQEGSCYSTPVSVFIEEYGLCVENSSLIFLFVRWTLRLLTSDLSSFFNIGQ